MFRLQAIRAAWRVFFNTESGKSVSNVCGPLLIFTSYITIIACIYFPLAAHNPDNKSADTLFVSVVIATIMFIICVVLLVAWQNRAVCIAWVNGTETTLDEARAEYTRYVTVDQYTTENGGREHIQETEELSYQARSMS